MKVVVANISCPKIKGNVGNQVTIEMLVNFSFRCDIREYDLLRVLQEDVLLPLDIVSD